MSRHRFSRTGGVVVCVCAVGLASCRSPVTPAESSRAALAAAVSAGPALPLEGRLSGGFAPFTAGVQRAGASEPVNLSPDVRIAIAQLEKRGLASTTPEHRADLGVAYLIGGDTARAITTLREAVAEVPRASTWSDLSAAYLTQARREPARRIESLARALDAARHSLDLQPSNDARFNRALALQQLAPMSDHTAAWQEYLQAERDPSWVDAATRHGRRQHAPAARDTWETRQLDLKARLTRLDREFVTGTVRQYPEAALEYFEREILVEWARAIARHAREAAASAVAQAQLLAASFETVTGDPSLSNEVILLRGMSPALARAHLAYAESVVAYESNDYARAKRLVEQALREFAHTRSQYQPWARVHLATIRFQQGDLAAADSDLAAVERDARAGDRSTLLGRTLWLRGLVFLAEWRLTEALHAFRGAAAEYENANEREYAVSLYHHLADALRMLGEQHESWQYIGRTLEGLPRVRKPLRRYLFLFNASLFASSQDLLEAALVFQDAAVREAARSAPEVSIEAATQRAAILLRRGDRVGAANDLDVAAERVSRVSDGYLRQGLEAEIAILRAQTATDGTSVDPVPAFRRAIEFFEGAEPARVPRLYLTLARLQMAAGSTAAAEDALGRGIERLERQQAALGDESLKISYFDDSWALFHDMVRLQLEHRRDAERAFEFAERSRARSLLAAAEGSRLAAPRRAAAVQAMLPPSTLLVYYVSLADRLLIWTISSTRFALIDSVVRGSDLSRLVVEHRDAIASRRAAPAANAQLHRALIQPVADAISASRTVVFVADGELQQLPFAALKNPATGRYLIEDVTIALTPSATFFVSALTRQRERSREIKSALLVGNPATAEASALPGAEAEASGAARFYPRHDVLRGAAATKERFVRQAPGYDVVHFGGHALANAEYPLLSRLLFAPDTNGDEDALFAHEIARMRFPRTKVVVLAACSTAAGTISRGEGIISAARPFLGAGVPAVVASQWDVDDRATERLFLAFHRELSKRTDPALALRLAQIELLQSGDRDYAAPASWAAFVTLGSTAP